MLSRWKKKKNFFNYKTFEQNKSEIEKILK